jgi:thioredoxin-like negative regulator of GroEL
VGFHFSHKANTAQPGRLAERVAAGGAVLVEFAEHDAPACRLQEPVLTQVLRHFADRLSVVQADVETSPADAAAFSVSAVPTFILFVDTVEKMRLVGYQSVDELTRAVDEVLAASS